MAQAKQTTPTRLPRRTLPPFETWSLVVFSLCTGSLVFFSVLNLLSDPGLTSLLRAAIIAIAATLVSYGINRFALEKGTELAATGFKVAGVVSVVSILAVGSGLFPSTYAGLTINDVKYNIMLISRLIISAPVMNRPVKLQG